jgi:probable addiction module antidote protein
MIDHIKNFDPAEHLEIDDPKFIQEYLDVMLEENGIEGLQRGLGHIAKAKGMSQLAKEINLGRESLYKSLSSTGKPKLETIDKVLKSFGMSLSIKQG